MGFRLLGACWGLGCGRARRGLAGSARIAIHGTLRPQTSLEGPVPFTAAVHSPHILSSCRERNKVGRDFLSPVLRRLHGGPGHSRAPHQPRRKGLLQMASLGPLLQPRRAAGKPRSLSRVLPP